MGAVTTAPFEAEIDEYADYCSWFLEEFRDWESATLTSQFADTTASETYELATKLLDQVSSGTLDLVDRTTGISPDDIDMLERILVRFAACADYTCSCAQDLVPDEIACIDDTVLASLGSHVWAIVENRNDTVCDGPLTLAQIFETLNWRNGWCGAHVRWDGSSLKVSYSDGTSGWSEVELVVMSDVAERAYMERSGYSDMMPEDFALCDDLVLRVALGMYYAEATTVTDSEVSHIDTWIPRILSSQFPTMPMLARQTAAVLADGWSGNFDELLSAVSGATVAA